MSDAANSQFKVVVTRAAERDLRGLKKVLNPHQLRRIDDKIQGLRTDPYPQAAEKLKGKENWYRLRDGNYRIVYGVDDTRRVVTIGRVRDRKDVYRK